MKANVFNNFSKKKENLVISLVLIGFFSLLLFNRGYISGFAVDLNQFGGPADGFLVNPGSQQILEGSIGKVNVEVNADYILPYILVYTRNEGWKKISLSGTTSTEDSNWLAEKATAELAVSQASNFHGTNVVLAYSCKKKEKSLDCHGDNYMAASFNLEFTFPQQSTAATTPYTTPITTTTQTGGSNTQPTTTTTTAGGNVQITTTNTQCPNLCNMQQGISYNLLGQPRQCVLAKKYNPSTGQDYTGTSPGVCEGEVKVRNGDLSSINSPRYNYAMGTAQEVNVPCRCASGVGYII